VYLTPAKMGAQTEEANVNAGLAAARQIVGFFEKNDRSFIVNGL
jgi:D-3-phosphoglycerate dehydrogenase